MKLISVQRKTRKEKRYAPKMGILYTQVTYVKKRFFLFPIKTLHKYRYTYYGEVKDCADCLLSR
jgi:hypothetical protein